jgi:histo-blood group ABO system transferase
MSKKAVVIAATNKYFALGLRLISHWNHHYKSDNKIDFIFISDRDPNEYSVANNIKHIAVTPSESFMEIAMYRWQVAIKLAESEEYDEIICVDADTTIGSDFTDENFSSEFTAMKHMYNDNYEHKMNNLIENNKRAASFFKFEDDGDHYHCGFVVATPEIFKDLGLKMNEWWQTDIANGVEARWHDESYFNKYVYTVRPLTKALDTKKLFMSLGDKAGVLFFKNSKLRAGAHNFDEGKRLQGPFQRFMKNLSRAKLVGKRWDISTNGTIVNVSSDKRW